MFSKENSVDDPIFIEEILDLAHAGRAAADESLSVLGSASTTFICTFTEYRRAPRYEQDYPWLKSVSGNYPVCFV
jgi:hypothetical protein